MDLLAGALRDVLQGVRSDGRVPRHLATRLREAVSGERRQREEIPSQDITSAIPAFETLPEATRQSLYAAVLSDDSWSMLFRRATLRQVLTRAVRTTGLKIPRATGAFGD